MTLKASQCGKIWRTLSVSKGWIWSENLLFGHVLEVFRCFALLVSPNPVCILLIWSLCLFTNWFTFKRQVLLWKRLMDNDILTGSQNLNTTFSRVWLTWALFSSCFWLQVMSADEHVNLQPSNFNLTADQFKWIDVQIFTFMGSLLLQLFSGRSRGLWD